MGRIAFEEIDKAEAITAARAAAFHYMDDEDPTCNRVIVHSFLNGWIGADWDIDNVVALIERAEGVYWQDGIAHHDLAVVVVEAGKRLQYNFDVPRPPTAEAGA